MGPEHRDPEMDARLQEWALGRTMASVEPNDAAKMEHIVQARIQERKRAQFRQVTLLAAAIVLAFIAVPQWRTQTTEAPTKPSSDITITTVPDTTLQASTSSEAIQEAILPEPLYPKILLSEGAFTQDPESNQFATEARLVLGLGNDVIGLDAQSQIQLDSTLPSTTRIQLDSGTVAAKVDSRGSEGSFQIISDDVVVEVIGTRFGVQRGTMVDHLRVWVSEGQVNVKKNSRSWTLTAGQELLIGPDGRDHLKEIENAHQTLKALLSLDPIEPSAPEIPEPIPATDSFASTPIIQSISSPDLPSLQSLRLALSNGDSNTVITSLQERLQHHPNDPDSWALLARAAQHSSDPALRLQALNKVIELGNGSMAQNARYSVAQILSQDTNNHAAARDMWQQFLGAPEGPGPLEDDAILELAKLELLSNNQEMARTLLLQITQKSVGTAAAREASDLLANMNQQ